MQVQVISKAGGSNKLIKEYIEAIQLKEESVVLIDVKIEDIEKIEYLDNKAIITLKNGEQIVIDNFNIEESSLVFRNENSELFLFDFETISYNPIDKIEPLLYGHSSSSFISIWPIAGLALGGIGLVAGAAGGSGSSSNQAENIPIIDKDKPKVEINVNTNGIITIKPNEPVYKADDKDKTNPIDTVDEWKDLIEVENGTVSIDDKGNLVVKPTNPTQDVVVTLPKDTVKDEAGNGNDKAEGKLPSTGNVELSVPTVVATITVITDNRATLKVVSDRGITGDNTPVVAGTATANSQVNVYANGVLVGQTTADNKGKWSLELPKQADGDVTIEAAEANAAGEGPKSAEIVITIDTKAPDAPTGIEIETTTTTDDEDNEIVDQTVTGKAPGEEGSTVVVQDKEGKVIAEGTVDEDGNFKVEIPSDKLIDEGGVVNVIVVDKAENKSNPKEVIRDDVAPSLISVEVTADGQLVLEFSEAIQVKDGLALENLNVQIDGRPVALKPTDISVKDGKLVITTEPAIGKGQEVAVSYTDTAGDQTTGVIEDLNGTDALSFDTAEEGSPDVENNSGLDYTAPELVKAEVNANGVIELTFDEDLDTDRLKAPGANQFTVSVNGNPLTTDEFTFEIVGKQVIITTTPVIQKGDQVEVRYNDITDIPEDADALEARSEEYNDAQALQDAAGNDVADFSTDDLDGGLVNNSTQDTIAPEAPTDVEIETITTTDGKGNSTVEQSVTGKAPGEEGSTVVVQDKEGKVIAEGTVDEDGNFKVEIPSDKLIDEGGVVNVIVVDKAENKSNPKEVIRDDVAPSLISVEVTADGQLVLEFSEAIQVKDGLALENLNVQIDGRPVALKPTDISVKDGKLVITTEPAIGKGQEVAVSYTDTAGDQTTGVIEDLNGTDALSFDTAEEGSPDVENNSGLDYTAPELVKAEVNANGVIELTFDEDLDTDRLKAPGANQFTVSVNGNPLTTDEFTFEIVGKQVIITTTPVIQKGDQVEVRYNDITDIPEDADALEARSEEYNDAQALQDAAGNDVADFSTDDLDGGLVNNSTQDTIAPEAPTDVEIETITTTDGKGNSTVEQSVTGKAPGEEGSTVVVQDKEGKVIAEGTVDEDGNFKVEIPSDKLIDEGGVVNVIVVDKAENKSNPKEVIRDDVAPSLISVEVTADGQLVLEFSEAIQVKDGLALENLNVQIDGRPVALKPTDISVKDGKLVITTEPAIGKGQEVAVSYTDTAGDQTTGVIEDLNGTDALSFDTAEEGSPDVENNSGLDYTAPELVKAEVNANGVIELTFDEDLDTDRLKAPGANQFTVSVNGNPLTTDEFTFEIVGKQVIITTTPVIQKGDQVEVRYNDITDIPEDADALEARSEEYNDAQALQDAAGNDVADFSTDDLDGGLVNNSTQDTIAPEAPTDVEIETITTTDGKGNSTVEQSVTGKAPGEEGSTVVVQDKEGKVIAEGTVDEDGNFKVEIPSDKLIDEGGVVNVIVVDKAENKSNPKEVIRDDVAPSLISVEVTADGQLVLEFSEAIQVKDGLALENLNVQIDGRPVALKPTDISVKDGKLVITTEPAIGKGQEVAVSYTDTAGDQTTGVIEDLNGTDALSFDTAEEGSPDVENNSGLDYTAPELVKAEVNANGVIELTFDEDLDTDRLKAPGANQFTVSVNGNPLTTDEFTFEIVGKQVIITTTPVIQKGDQVEVRYNDITDIPEDADALEARSEEYNDAQALQDAAGNDVADFSTDDLDGGLVNNSTQDTIAPEAPTDVEIETITTTDGKGNSTVEQSVTGKAPGEEGSTVVVQDKEGKVIAEGTVDEDGNFKVEIPSDKLIDEGGVVNVIVVDKAENKSNPKEVIRDDVAPSLISVEVTADGQLVLEFSEAIQVKDGLALENLNVQIDGRPVALKPTDISVKDGKLVITTEPAIGKGQEVAVSYTDTAGDQTTGVIEDLNGTDALSFDTAEEGSPDVENNSGLDYTAPELVKAEVNANGVIELTFDEDLDTDRLKAPGANQFTVSVNGNPLTTDEFTFEIVGKQVIITTTPVIQKGDQVEVRYNDITDIPEDADALEARSEEYNDAQALQDAAGNDVADFSTDDLDGGLVNNSTQDTIAPEAPTDVEIETITTTDGKGNSTVEQSVTGKAPGEEGSTVVVQDKEGKVIAEGTVDEDGNFKVEIPSDKLIDEGGVVNVIVVDKAENKSNPKEVIRDDVAPSLISVEVTADGQLVLEFSEAIQVKDGLALENLNVQIDGRPVALKPTDISVKDGKLVITTEPAIGKGQEVAVSYTDTAGDQTTGVIEDLNGTDALSFDTAEEGSPDVENNSGLDYTAPELVKAEVNANGVIELTFDEDLDTDRLKAPGANQFTVSVNGNPLTTDEFTFEIVGKQVIITTTPVIQKGDQVEVRYNDITDIPEDADALEARSEEYNDAQALQDAAGNDVADFSTDDLDGGLVNNSTQDTIAPDLKYLEILFNSITEDNVINNIEATSNIIVSGSLKNIPEDVSRSKLTLDIGGKTYVVSINGDQWFVSVLGSDLIAGLTQGVKNIEAHYQAFDSSGNMSEKADSHQYQVNIQVNLLKDSEIIVHNISDDGKISDSEINEVVLVSGSLTDFPSNIALSELKINIQVGTQVFEADITGFDPQTGLVSWIAEIQGQVLASNKNVKDGSPIVTVTAALIDSVGNIHETTPVDKSYAIELSSPLIELNENELASNESVSKQVELIKADGFTDIQLELPVNEFGLTWSFVNVSTKDHLVAKYKSGVEVFSIILSQDEQGAYILKIYQNSALAHDVNSDITSIVVGLLGATYKNININIIDDKPIIKVVDSDIVLDYQGGTYNDTVVEKSSVDGSYVSSVKIEGQTYSYNGESINLGTLSSTSEIYQHYANDSKLTINTYKGERVEFDFETGQYSVTALAQGASKIEPNPQISSSSDGDLLNLVDTNLLGLIEVSSKQAFYINPVGVNVTSVTLKYAPVVELLSVPYFNARKKFGLTPREDELLVKVAESLGLKIEHESKFWVIGGSAELVIKPLNEGDYLDPVKVNELLALVKLSSGGLSSLLNLEIGKIFNFSYDYEYIDNGIKVVDTKEAETEFDLLSLGLLDKLLNTSDENVIFGSNDQMSSSAINVYGDAQDNLINGSAYNDVLRGGAGEDTINGGAGNDLIVGGQGNDILTGGSGTDIYRWEQGDQGTTGDGKAIDTIKDFDTVNSSLGGKVLDLQTFLNGAYANGYMVGNLQSYLYFVNENDQTSLYISTNGKFTNQNDVNFNAIADQKIIFENLDLFENGQYNNVTLIESLIGKGKLIIDQLSYDVEGFDNIVTIENIELKDNDGDVVKDGNINVQIDTSKVGQDAPINGDPDTNTSPKVAVGQADLLGLLGVGLLGIDLNRQSFVAYDAENNINKVVISNASLVNVELTKAYITANEDLARELGLEITHVSNKGVLGLNLLGAGSSLQITAIDGGPIDNIKLNELLGTVTIKSAEGVLLTSELLKLGVLSGFNMTVEDIYGKSESKDLGSLADLNLLSYLGDNRANFIFEGGNEADKKDFSNSEHSVRMYGGDGDDILKGGMSSDLIRGGYGNDHLYGGAGNDYLVGGLGNDTAIYELLAGHETTKDGGNGTDVWADFTLGNPLKNIHADKIDISSLLIGYEQGSDLKEFISIGEIDGKAVVQIDRDGKSNDGFEFTDLLVLQNQTVTTQQDQIDLLNQLIANHQIIG
ncbi:SwmB domain-containing protein [Acinetobacter thermotolerans]|uniref:SwmB domain-containing protein n=1 Tax=Acinetobacter thermotolerans TaxID=3151487 RepID=UPI00325ACEE0